MYTLSLLFVAVALSAAIGAMATTIVVGAQWRAYMDAMRSADDERYAAHRRDLFRAWDELAQAHRDLAQVCAERDAYARNLADAQDGGAGGCA